MNLLRIRKKLGKSQIEMAKLIGVTIGTYVNWEREVMNPNEDNQQKLDELFPEEVVE